MYTRSWSCHQAASSVGRPAFVTEHALWDERQVAAAEQIEADLSGIDLVRLVFCDPHGLARSKTLTAETFRTVLRDGMDFSPGPFLFDTAHAVAIDFLSPDPGVEVDELVGAGDFVVVPDPLTFVVLPTPGPRTAWVIGDEYLRNGSPHPLSSRAVLRRVCSRYAERDLLPVIGLEVEWYLTRALGGAPGSAGNGFGSQGAAPSVAAVNAGYQFNLDSYSDAVAPVTGPLFHLLQGLGLPLRTIEHESGPGQMEFTFNPLLAADAADAMLLFRTMVKQECAHRGYHASFMALPRLDGFDPSGWHLHQSVVNATTGSNVFGSDDAEGLSAEGKAYLEGLLARAREFCLLSVPSINGYRRFGTGFALSPTRIGSSYEDRSVMVRVLGVGSSTHLENRTGEPCANPYLAIASQVSAGLGVMTGEQSPAAAPDGTEPETLPLSLRAALDVFRTSDHVRELLGAPLAACLAKIKETEVSRYEAWAVQHQPAADEVSEWEHREYFGVF
jgi:glutamine synthetase